MSNDDNIVVSVAPGIWIAEARTLLSQNFQKESRSLASPARDLLWETAMYRHSHEAEGDWGFSQCSKEPQIMRSRSFIEARRPEGAFLSNKLISTSYINRRIFEINNPHFKRGVFRLAGHVAAIYSMVERLQSLFLSELLKIWIFNKRNGFTVDELNALEAD